MAFSHLLRSSVTLLAAVLVCVSLAGCKKEAEVAGDPRIDGVQAKPLPQADMSILNDPRASGGSGSTARPTPPRTAPASSTSGPASSASAPATTQATTETAPATGESPASAPASGPEAPATTPATTTAP